MGRRRPGPRVPLARGGPAVAAPGARRPTRPGPARHTVLATSTGSGKSLAFWLPALSTARSAAAGSLLDPGRIESVTRRATTLYLCPTKALAADQLAALDRLLVAAPHPRRPRRHLRRRHLARGAPLGPGARRRGAHQPRLPALRPAPPAPPVGAPARVAAVRGGRRVPRVPRRVRRARRAGPAAAAPARRLVRGDADLPAGVRDHLRPGRERRPADRRRPVRGHRRDRRRLPRRPQDVRPVAAARSCPAPRPRGPRCCPRTTRGPPRSPCPGT